MSKKIIFENYFAKRVMEIKFPDGFSLQYKDDLDYLKAQWSQNLKMWHSPYTCLFDCRQFELSESMTEPFEKLLSFFSHFFMKKIVGYSSGQPFKVPFEILGEYNEAREHLGLDRVSGATKKLENLRDRIQIDNDFNAHVMEVQFLEETFLETTEDFAILKDKIKNNLRLWHTPFSILFDCRFLTLSSNTHQDMLSFERFLKGFFCKKVAGYSPKESKEKYPFETFRSRHAAAGVLENQGLQSGATANCASKKNLQS